MPTGDTEDSVIGGFKKQSLLGVHNSRSHILFFQRMLAIKWGLLRSGKYHGGVEDSDGRTGERGTMRPLRRFGRK